MRRVYLSLGSNLGDRAAALRAAREALELAGVRVLRSSALYETEPQDVTDQAWFLNSVLEADTELLPKQLLARTQAVEQQMGRKRVRPKGPRSIDIDILLYGSSVIDTGSLVIPHPGLAERRFVLEPLAELAPDLRHPVTRRSVREMLGAVQTQKLRRYPSLPVSSRTGSPARAPW